MVARTGPARLALFLTCWMGALLSVHTAPVRQEDLRMIIIELKSSTDDHLKTFNETGLPVSAPYAIESFAPFCRPPHYINSSALLPYFKAISSSSRNTVDISDIIQQLYKLEPRLGPESQVEVPKDDFEWKRFSLAVFQEFSMCIKSLKP
uniref:Interleukin 31 n=1 Tax=Molossus molossus TaxID=27622 RepID=A0A7J8BXW9_MOLMO|nr:interleukin 31 [Molossus molossus]